MLDGRTCSLDGTKKIGSTQVSILTRVLSIAGAFHTSDFCKVSQPILFDQEASDLH